MAAKPGEENVATLFADIHYFYGPETDHPPHHRFDKGSYVYLFENAQAGCTRIEVANRPGSALQDAFDGYLDCTSVTYSYRHSCMVSLTVHDVPGPDAWHLPTYDPHNQQIYHYKLHSLDLYFWTPRDALQFVNGVRRLLPASQQDIEEEPLPPPPQPAAAAAVSPVVQKLEHLALERGGSAAASSTHTAPSFAPPPLSAVSADSAGSHPAAFVPMAYNPAAPAAPEAIRPREKTPPPEDAAAHHPLHTLAQDAATPFSPGLVVPTGLGPLSPALPNPAFQPPPGAPVFAGPPPSYVSQGNTHLGFQPFAQPAVQPVQTTTQAPHPGITRAITMPAASPFGPSFAAPPTAPFQQQTPTPPPNAAAAIAGYSQYSYSAAAAAPNHDYAVHQQLYRPTGGETVSYTPKQDPRGRFEDNAGRIERGVTGMLKKFEKKFG